MKQFTLFSLVLLLCCPLWVQAQLSKGTWYASGSTVSGLPVASGLAGLSYFDELGTVNNLFGLGLSPEFGYFFSKPNVNYNFDSESLRVGLDLGIQFFLNPKGKE